MTLRLRGTTTVSALLFVAFATLAGAQSPSSSPIAKALGEFVLGQTVRSKIPLSVESIPYARPHPRLVATDFYEDGDIKYQVYERRKGGIPVPTGQYVAEPRMVQPGWLLNVFGIQYFSDRIEFDGTNDGIFNLVLGNGYATWPTDRVMNILYKVISIPAIDMRVDLENQYKTMTAQLKSNVDSAQPANPPVSLDAQIEEKTALYKKYRSIADVAAKLRSMHDPVISSDSTDYGALAEGVDNQLVALYKAADVDRKQKAEQKRIQAIQVLQQKEAEDEADLQKVFLQLDKSEVRSDAESNKRAEALKSAQEMADDWLRWVNVLALANLDLSADRKRLEAANQHIQRLQAALDASSARIHAQGIDAKYQSMVLKLAQLKSAYASAFGTPGADAAKANLKTLLSQMIVNRESAAAAGSAAAEQQAQQLRVELGRLR